MAERRPAGPILLTHRFFWPDTAPYGVILKKLALHLGESDDREVHIFTTRPSYREGIEAPDHERLARTVSVRRGWAMSELHASLPARALNAVVYSLALVGAVLRLRPSLVTASTFPPVVAAWCAAMSARLVGAEFVYHVQDIHPDISELRSGRTTLLTRVLRTLDGMTLRAASAVVVPGRDMADTLLDRGAMDDPSKVRVIPNCSLVEESRSDDPLPPTLRHRPDERRIIFAGNLGRFQDLERVVEGIAGALPSFPDTHLLLLGDGVLRPELEARWGGHPQVRFHPLVEAPIASRAIEEAEIAVLPLDRGIDRVAYPSKLSAYAAAGTPILAALSPQSDLARTIEGEGLGQVVATPSADAFRSAIRQLRNRDPGEQRVGCRRWYEAVASEARMLEAWDELLDEIRR